MNDKSKVKGSIGLYKKPPRDCFVSVSIEAPGLAHLWLVMCIQEAGPPIAMLRLSKKEAVKLMERIAHGLEQLRPDGEIIAIDENEDRPTPNQNVGTPGGLPNLRSGHRT